MLLPSSPIDGFDAIVHAVDAELVVTKSHHFTMLEVGSVGGGIVATLEAFVQNPAVAEDEHRPVS